MGSKSKFWFLDRNRPVLFKAVREGTGEDWTEKVAQEISRLISVPTAVYDLAVSNGERGVITPTFVDDGQTLIHGNELLAGLDASYAEGSKRESGRTHLYTVELVILALDRSGARLRSNWILPHDVVRPSDVFTGILMLDALVGNTDRHQENWAILEKTSIDGVERTIAPQFDCASCLGRNESDEKKLKRLQTQDAGFTPEAYADRAMSPFYSPAALVTQLTPLQAFLAAGKLRPGAASAWLSRLDGLTTGSLERLFSRIPAARLSVPSRDFAMRMLKHNRAMLLQTRGEFL